MTANIKNNPDMPDAQVRADVREAKSLGNLISFQEIEEDADHRAVSEELGSGWVVLYNSGTKQNPLCYAKDDYSHTASACVKLHDGKAGVCPTMWFCWARMDPANPNIRGFIALSTHFVSGAWTNPGQEAEQWRKDMWNKSYRMVQDFVEARNAAGEDVLLMGDFNNPDMAKFTSSQRTVAHQKYDYIIVCPASGSSDLNKKGDARWVNLNSDHNAGAVTLGP